MQPIRWLFLMQADSLPEAFLSAGVFLARIEHFLQRKFLARAHVGPARSRRLTPELLILVIVVFWRGLNDVGHGQLHCFLTTPWPTPKKRGRTVFKTSSSFRASSSHSSSLEPD
jgi:hypothetical protein